MSQTVRLVVRKTVYTFHAGVADRWRLGRVFIAGDAAHLTPPYAGQGMNSGIRDVHNLGWKLAAVISHRAGSALLDTYEVERRDYAWALIKLVLNLGIVMAPKTQARAIASSALLTAAGFVPPLRRYLMQMRFKPKPRFDAGIVLRQRQDALAGTMFPQPLVQGANDETRLLDEVIGPSFCLIQLGGTEVFSHLQHSLWQVLETKHVLIQPVEHLERDTNDNRAFTVVRDVGGELASLFAKSMGTLCLLRPDRYVAAVFSLSQESQVAAQLAQMMGMVDKQAPACGNAYSGLCSTP